ncbi:MAG TPA: DUF2130 domain-containing protein [Chitinophagaceae bacterium]|jgi:hypothetical protein|nr:DUF2130 domain-containing protein [Chitinophagaceae bacterium]
MATTIKCPKCGNEFEPNESIRDQIKKELNQKAIEWQKRKDEEFQLKMDEEKKRIQQHLEENIRRSISLDYENQLRLLAQTNKDNEEKLKEARQQQLELFKKEQELKNREAELELSVQKKLQLERERLSVEIRKLEEQRIATIETEYRLRMKEMEEKLEAQRKLAEEMRRKAEQGSMQLQGEVQELALEEMLQTAFPFDLILEVGKGVRGADCIQIVRSNFGQECGKIIYESKRTNAFANEWVEKLKTDMRSQGAEIAVLVTRAMPRDMDCFGIKDGVWVCDFSEVKALASVLREGVIRVFNTAKSNENKGDKMHLLYGYLTSSEFAEQWKAIREGFLAMKLSIQRERESMERLWKAREKQLEKVLLNAAHIRGSIEGIAGMDAVDLNLLENGEEDDSLFSE